MFIGANVCIDQMDIDKEVSDIWNFSSIKYQSMFELNGSRAIIY